MRHKSSVYRAIAQYLPWGEFDRLVDELGGDKGVRRLTMQDQFCAMLYGQLAGAASLREIECGLESHKARLYHVNAKPVKRSTLADANGSRPAAVFTGVFQALMKQAHRGLRRSLEETVYLIDSTSLRLNALSEKWAQFSTGVCGAKAHVIYDADAGCPVYMAITAAKVNDISAAKDMPLEAGATYVFDLGYYDYGWWSKIDEAGCRIVTRFKSNTPLCGIEERPVAEGGSILADRVEPHAPQEARSITWRPHRNDTGQQTYGVSMLVEIKPDSRGSRPAIQGKQCGLKVLLDGRVKPGHDNGRTWQPLHSLTVGKQLSMAFLGISQ